MAGYIADLAERMMKPIAVPPIVNRIGTRMT
jgi:hypothetical protein